MSDIDKEAEKFAENLVRLTIFTEDALIELFGMRLFLKRRGLLKEFEADEDLAGEVRELFEKIYGKLEKE